MSQMNQVQDDEINFFELFQTLWDGKWLISAFVAIAVLLGSGFLLLKDAVYESKLFLSVDVSVPFDEENVTLNPFEQKFYIDFQKKFYSEKLFEDWKESNSNTSLVFKDFSATEVVDGFVLSKSKANQLVTFQLDKADNAFILVKTNRLPLVLDVFKYSNHINEMLKRDYVFQAKNDLKNIDLIFKNGGSVDGASLKTFLSINGFIVSAEKGTNVLVIESPLMPKKVSPKSDLILAISLVLGGMIGVMYVLISNGIHKHKEQLAKT